MILVKFIYSNFFLYLNILLFFSCHNNNEFVITGLTMGTTYTVKINTSITTNPDEIKSEIDSILVGLNNIFSTYDINSEISLINSSNSKRNKISDELSRVLSKSLFYAELSNGFYDPTVYPLIELWGFSSTNTFLKPSHEEIMNIKKNISYKEISILEQTLYRSNINSYIDLSSIAKGYAVDTIFELLISKGYDNLMIDIGGELRCLSGKDNPWIVGISNPTKSGVYLETKIDDFSIATSGTYNNFTVYDGVEYSHIINPKTGYPINNSILSCTVLSKHCVDADALATILMLLPVDDSLSLIEGLDKTECIILVKDDNSLIEFKSRGFDKFIND